MIIKGKEDRRLSNYWLLIPTILLFGIAVIRFYNPESNTNDNIPITSIRCGAEVVENENFVDNGFIFEGGTTQTNEKVLVGQYSSKIGPNEQYGLKYSFNEPLPGKRYKVSVWSFNEHPVDASLIVSAKDSTLFYKSTGKTVERNGTSWDRRELSFTIPSYEGLDYIQVFVKKSYGPNTIYFDEFEITEVLPTVSLDSSEFEVKSFDLLLDLAARDYIKKMREKSISQGLVYHDDSKVRVKINDNGRAREAKIRLKGDWLDHLGVFPSYRVDMADDESWMGMQSFSVQEPATRGFLRQWVFFKYLDIVDVIHPRFDFIRLKTNGIEPVVFSYEEHFTKNLIEHNERREGPILKMTEDRFWDMQKRTMQSFDDLADAKEKDKSYWSSEIRSFKENKLLNNPEGKNQFVIAQNLLHQFKYNLKPPSEIFDLEIIAKYLALVDICLAEHAVSWHNQRFYYNPITALLEPIAFDTYSNVDPDSYAHGIYAEELYTSNRSAYEYEPIDQLFFDEEFVKLYFSYLYTYSQPDFVESIMDKLEKGISEREKFLRTRFLTYSYDRHEIIDKAKKVQIAFPAFKNSLLVYQEKESNEEQHLKLLNTHGFPLLVYLGKHRDDGIIVYPQKRVSVPEYVDFNIPLGLRNVHFEVVGLDEVYTTEIVPWPHARNASPRQMITDNTLDQFKEILESNGELVVFKKGHHLVSKPLIIPKQKKVLIKAGTTIEFEKQGFLLSRSAVDILGEKDSPVLIKSNDMASGSFTILMAEGISTFRHVQFENQNTLNFGNWNLTGSVNFYESNAKIYHAVFKNNHCEDALNIIRSDFTVEYCMFINTFGDAIDVDFSNGKIEKCSFSTCGNDALDLSGSVVNISDVRIAGTGDKGISAGERSIVSVKNSIINDCPLGIASKDFSELTVENVDIADCKTGIAAFQKKPEFGPGSIQLHSYTMNRVKKKFMIEKGSVLYDHNIQ